MTSIYKVGHCPLLKALGFQLVQQVCVLYGFLHGEQTNMAASSGLTHLGAVTVRMVFLQVNKCVCSQTLTVISQKIPISVWNYLVITDCRSINSFFPPHLNTSAL